VGGKAAVNGELPFISPPHRADFLQSPEAFWIDLVFKNPLDADINLSNLTVVVEEMLSSRSVPAESVVEVIDDVVLGPKETRTVGQLLVRQNSYLRCEFIDTRGREICPACITNCHACEVRFSFVVNLFRAFGVSWPQTTGDRSAETERCVRSRCSDQGRS
jgi:hypothetical protein